MRQRRGSHHCCVRPTNPAAFPRTLPKNNPTQGLPPTSSLDNLKKSPPVLVQDPSLTIHDYEPGQLLIEVDLSGLGSTAKDSPTVLLQSIPGTSEVQITTVGGDESVDLRLIPDESEVLVRALELCSEWQRAEKMSHQVDRDFELDSD